MIQQLFPNRTREQMKLKFKLEERRNPLKLNDALSSRSKRERNPFSLSLFLSEYIIFLDGL